MLIRKATGEEMLKLWGCQEESNAPPTAKFFYKNISSGNAVFWTLDNAGELIGELYAFLDVDGDKDFADGKTTAYLCAFRVKKEYRGQGLGSKMMDIVLKDLKARGFQYATIGVSEEQNEKLYRRMGFTAKVKDCHIDPCAMDGNMQPEHYDACYNLLSKEL